MKLAIRLRASPGKYDLKGRTLRRRRGVFAQMKDGPFHLHHDDEEGEDYKLSCYGES
jgi:hypothetical protein